MRVIGTAGHVDHGKSTLVKALTGIDPDRLKEEKARQMTIDLGFAWFVGESGEEIGIVDVPGHRDFMENMLSGISAIDAALLVIAADEGPMPQTREHLAVIDLLKIQQGIIVLTKVDLVQDDDWLELVNQDIRRMLSGTSLEGKQILPVSAMTGQGMEALKTSILEMLSSIPLQTANASPRLPIDRVFSMTGFGTIVTGTLGGGQFTVGDQVEISPPGKAARIRGIQVYHKPVQTAKPGSRAAINLTGIEPRDIQRGSVLISPGTFSLTSRFDTHVELIKELDFDLKNHDQVKLFVATTECIARARILGKDRLIPGESGFIQFELNEPIVLAEQDRFILRRLSPANTIGGGVVLHAHPAKRYRLNDRQVIEQLERALSPTYENQILNLIESNPYLSSQEIRSRIGINAEDLEATMMFLVQNGKVLFLAPDNYISTVHWTNGVNKAKKKIEQFHQSAPLLTGIPVDALGKHLEVPKPLITSFLEKLEQTGLFDLEKGKVKKANRKIKFSPGQQSRINEYVHLVNSDRYNSPTVKTTREMLGDEVYESLIDQELFVQVSPEVVLGNQEYQEMIQFVIEECDQKGSITVIMFRDHFATNRKISLALLEHLDSRGVTVRQGDVRVLKKT